MGVADLPRWLWLSAAVVVGLLHGTIREWSTLSDPLDDYEVLLTDQRQFEHALVAERHGHRLFKDVTVYPHWVRHPSGERRLVHLVTGRYWDGRTEVKDGAVQARWDPACFVAPSPYREDAGTVLEYLAKLRDTKGLPYQYAWWWWTRRPLFTSTAASVAALGVALPTALNLVAFGTLLRPRTEKRPSLWRVRIKRRYAPPAGALTVATAARSEPQALPAVAAGEPRAERLPHRPLPPAEPVLAVAKPSEEKHFGAERDDFYPTELHVAAPPKHSA